MHETTLSLTCFYLLLSLQARLFTFTHPHTCATSRLSLLLFEFLPLFLLLLNFCFVLLVLELAFILSYFYIYLCTYDFLSRITRSQTRFYPTSPPRVQLSTSAHSLSNLFLLSSRPRARYFPSQLIRFQTRLHLFPLPR